MARLKAKRFRQIFKYLDQKQDGFVDLLDLTTGDAQKTCSVRCLLSVLGQLVAHLHTFSGHDVTKYKNSGNSLDRPA